MVSGQPDPNLPALGNLDGYVRPLLAALSSRPELAALLASDGLVRRFAVSVEAIARGASPAGQVRAVAPRAPFQVQQEGGHMVVNPASYERYDGLVALVEDMEPGQLARLYGRLKPRLEEAYAELGAGGTFDDAMTRTIRHLLATPALPAAPASSRRRAPTTRTATPLWKASPPRSNSCCGWVRSGRDACRSACAHSAPPWAFPPIS